MDRFKVAYLVKLFEGKMTMIDLSLRARHWLSTQTSDWHADSL